MENLAFKIKILALWILTELTIFHPLLFFKPGVIQGIIDGEFEGIQLGPEIMLFFAIMYLVPLVMAFLSLTLKGSTNRWANVILGIVYAGFSFFDLADMLSRPSPSAFMTLLAIIGVVFPALIVWYAWKWPKKEE